MHFYFLLQSFPPFTSPHPLSRPIFSKCSVIFHGTEITTGTRLLGVKPFKNTFSSFSSLLDSSSVQADNPVCKTPLCHAMLQDPLNVHPNNHVYLLLGTIFSPLEVIQTQQIFVVPKEEVFITSVFAQPLRFSPLLLTSSSLSC